MPSLSRSGDTKPRTNVSMKGRRVCSQPTATRRPALSRTKRTPASWSKSGIDNIASRNSRLTNARPDWAMFTDRTNSYNSSKSSTGPAGNAQVRGQLGSRHQRIVNEPKHR